jgi:hypothetical protein
VVREYETLSYSLILTKSKTQIIFCLPRKDLK